MFHPPVLANKKNLLSKKRKKPANTVDIVLTGKITPPISTCLFFLYSVMFMEMKIHVLAF